MLGRVERGPNIKSTLVPRGLDIFTCEGRCIDFHSTYLAPKIKMQKNNREPMAQLPTNVAEEVCYAT